MNYKIVLLIHFVFLIFACKQKPPEEKPVEKSTDRLTELNSKLNENPNDAAILKERAEYFYGKQNIKQAHEDITRAISIDSTHDDYYILLANINFTGLQIQRAIDAFKKAISLNPQNSESHIRLAELYLYLKSYKESLNEANEALRIDKNIAKAYFIKGFAYKESGDTLKALSSFQTAVEVKSDYYDAYIQLGNILSVRRDPLALQYYNNALKIRPTSTEALYNRGLFMQNIDEIERAIEDYHTILKIDPAYQDAHYNLGYIDMAMRNDYPSAIRHFTNAIRIDNNYVEAFYNRGLCYESSGDNESAIKDYQSALAIVPTYELAKKRMKALGK